MIFNKDDPNHDHTFYPLQQGAHKQVFEKIDASDNYKLVNYLLMFCKCGEALMREVEVKRKTDEPED